MKKILVPLCERDYLVTEKRFIYILQSLSSSFAIEVCTDSKEVLEDITGKLSGFPNAAVRLIEPVRLPLGLDFRTNLVKIFVQYAYDLFIAHTDLKLWKVAAFDDFWGHIAHSSFDALSVLDADAVLLPLLSYDDTPPEEMDVFYTSVLFKAKEKGIAVVGYQLYPVFQGLKLMPLLVDAVVVTKEYERAFYLEQGLSAERLHLLTAAKDVYALSSIDDTYKNHLFNSQIPVREHELAVVVHNHAKYRPQIREIIKAVGDTGLPVVLLFVKRDYHVRELKEDEIIQDFYFDDIKATGCRFYLVETQSTVPVIMTADTVVSPTYIAPVEFAARYGKKTYVYNPFYEVRTDVEGTVFINTPKDLTAALRRAYDAKQRSVGMIKTMNAILR